MFSGGEFKISMAPTGECISQQFGTDPAASCTDSAARLGVELLQDCVGPAPEYADQCAGVTTGITEDGQSQFVLLADDFQANSLPPDTQNRLPAIFGTADTASALAACGSMTSGYAAAAPAVVTAPPEGDGQSGDVMTFDNGDEQGGGLNIPVTIVDNGVVQNEGDEQVEGTNQGARGSEEPAEEEEHNDESGIPTLMLSVGIGYSRAFATGLYDPLPLGLGLGDTGGDWTGAAGNNDWQGAGGTSGGGYGADASNGMTLDLTLKYFPVRMGSFGVYISAGGYFGWNPVGEISNTSIADPYVSNKTNPSDFVSAGGRIGAGVRLDVGFALDLGLGARLGWLGLVNGGPGFPTDIDNYIDYSEFSYGLYARLGLGFSWGTLFAEYDYDGGHMHGYVDPSMHVEGREISPQRHQIGVGIEVDIPIISGR